MAPPPVPLLLALAATHPSPDGAAAADTLPTPPPTASDRTPGPAGGANDPPSSATVTPLLFVATDVVVYAGTDTTVGRGDQATGEGIRLRRVRAGVDARQGLWQARAVLELSTDGDAPRAIESPARDPPRLTEAFVRWRPAAAFHAEAGSLRVPFSLSRQADEADQRLPERALSVQSIAPEFRVGAAAGGDLGLFQYAAGVYATDPAPAEPMGPTERGTMVAARLAGEPLGPMGVAPWLRRSSDPWWPWWRYAVGGSFFYEWRDHFDNYGLEGDVQFQRGRFTATGEILWSRHGPQRLGLVVEPGFFVWRDRLELCARAEWFDTPYGRLDDGGALVAASGASYYAFAGRARLSAMYHHREDRRDARANDWALLRLAFSL